VRELESRIADMFAMGSALFVPTGRLANLMAIGALTEPGTEALLDADAHVMRSEYGMVSRVWGVQTRTFVADCGRVTWTGISPLLAGLENPTVRTALVCLEDTHSVHGGVAQDLACIAELAGKLAPLGIGLYCDGARLWYANAVQDVPLARYGQQYDGLSVSLVKGIGAPVGAVVMLREPRRPELRRLRRMLGGAWVRPGPLAHAALRALDVGRQDARRDCANAALLAAALRGELPELEVRQETNVVMFDVPDSAAFFENAKAAGVLVFRYTPTRIRAVLHRGITAADAERAAAILSEIRISVR
jgi:threonine aldolase